MDLNQIIQKLRLAPLPGEGGYYRETYKSPETIDGLCLPEAYTDAHALGTCIYYLITPESFSQLHKLPTEEIWHFYLGDAAEQIQISPQGEMNKIRLGNDLQSGCVPQVIVPRNTWQATKLLDGGKFALFGTTMSPGFAFADYIPGHKIQLQEAYPAIKDEIEKCFHNPK